MADEIPEEKKEEENEKEELEGEDFGEAEKKDIEEKEEVEEEQSERPVSTEGESLLSDFCKPVSAYEEEPGEQTWVCDEYEAKDEYFRGFGPYEEYQPEGEEEEEEEYFLEEKRSLDSEYLKSVLGTPLTFAMLEIATKRPTDPIQFLGHYLLSWRWNGENKARYEERVKELNAERAALLAKMREKERQEMLEREEREEEMRRRERVESSIEEDDLGEGHGLVAEEGG